MLSLMVALVAFWEMVGFGWNTLLFLPAPSLLYFLFPNVYSDLPKVYKIVHLCRKDRQKVSIKFGGNLQWGLSGT